MWEAWDESTCRCGGRQGCVLGNGIHAYPGLLQGLTGPMKDTNDTSVLEILSYWVWLLCYLTAQSRDDESTERHSQQNQLLEAEKS